MSAPASQVDAQLLVETTDGIATVTLNWPALSSALISDLQSTLDRIAADRPPVWPDRR
jgi:enoyl-CoA hydratase/carnithine racemase